MDEYQNEKNGTQLCISPLMAGIGNDLKLCSELLDVGVKNGMMPDEFNSVLLYMMMLNKTKSDILVLDKMSVGIPELIRKYMKGTTSDEQN